MFDKAEYPQLSNPPIVEAVFDIAVSETDFNADIFSNLQEVLGDNFSTQEKINIFSSEISFDDKGQKKSSSIEDKILGYTYKTKDSKETLQLRVNGFSYHRIQSYDKWDNFFESAIKYWKIYRQKKKDIEINRTGLRFINLINTRSAQGSFDELFKIYLSFNSHLNEDRLSGFQYRYIADFSERDCSAMINFVQTDSKSAENDNRGYIFDIDVFKLNPVPADIQEADLRGIFCNMRDVKNFVFFNTLGEKALEPYK